MSKMIIDKEDFDTLTTPTIDSDLTNCPSLCKEIRTKYKNAEIPDNLDLSEFIRRIKTEIFFDTNDTKVKIQATRSIKILEAVSKK